VSCGILSGGIASLTYAMMRHDRMSHGMMRHDMMRRGILRHGMMRRHLMTHSLEACYQDALLYLRRPGGVWEDQ